MTSRAAPFSRYVLTLTLLVLAAGSLASRQQKAAGELVVGATPEQVRARLGQPDHVSRQIFSHRSLEQWHYRLPHNLRLVFECPRGEVPRLIQMRPTEPAGRRE